MFRTIKHTLAVVALAALIAAPGAPRAMAQSGGGYDLTWNDVEGSGAVSAGSGYELFSVAGQHDAGPLSGGGYSLAGGFLVPPTYQAYLPVVLRP